MGTMGERLRQVRESTRLKQDDFASEIGVHINTLSRWERDLGSPSGKALECIRQKYAINVEWLLSGEGSMKSWPSSLKVEIAPTEHSATVVAKGDSIRALDAIDVVLSDAIETINMIGLKVEPVRLAFIYKYLIDLVSNFDRQELRIIGGAISRWASISAPFSKPESNQD